MLVQLTPSLLEPAVSMMPIAKVQIVIMEHARLTMGLLALGILTVIVEVNAHGAINALLTLMQMVNLAFGEAIAKATNAIRGTAWSTLIVIIIHAPMILIVNHLSVLWAHA